MNNILEPKTVKSLLEYNFFVGSYQRGYRWGKIEVETLLRDIKEFIDNKHDIYWLQPIIVRKKEGQGNLYELIDGQQRLTTSMLILRFLGYCTDVKITYETRQKNNINFFLKLNEVTNISGWEEFICEYPNLNKIDNFHFFTAYKTIQTWFNESKYNELFLNVYLEKVKLIWYEIVNPEVDAKEIFEQINIGKIPLTNAELVKALYFNSNVDKNMRYEVSQKWDRIEYMLQDPQLWSFISNDVEKLHNRIEFILDLVSDKNSSNNNKEERLHTFLYFNNETEGDLKFKWEKVEKYFEMFLFWFSDPKLFHYIGFIVTTKFSSIRDLSKKYLNSTEGKDSFINTIIEIIGSKIKDIDIDKLYYGKSNEKIINILLLFNIQSNLNSTPFVYFPFHKYKEQGKVWTLEHIHAQKSNDISDNEGKIKWINQTLKVLEKVSQNGSNEVLNIISELKKRIAQGANINLEDLPQRIYDLFKDGDTVNIDHITNMALLDRETNSLLQNGEFPIKREDLFEIEKTKKRFIPNCTKLVFLKYYSSERSNMYFWGIQDREDYMTNIKLCLEPFLNYNNN